ncbi:MAG: dihydroorotase [Clostridiales bacterium]|nr:dihydroorotase [Clostridiales bacterium]
MNTLIKNGMVVAGETFEKADVYIQDNKIVKIGKDIDCAVDTEIDAEGKIVLPGFVDMHCHLREPGLEYKEDIAHGSLAALRGGFTSIACMPNTRPPIDNAALVSYVRTKGIEADNAKVYPIGCITKGQAGKEIAEMGFMRDAGAVAFSDDGLPVANSNVMRMGLEYAASIGALIISHSEDKELSGDGVVNEGLNATVSGLKGITRAAEECMVARDVLLAETFKTRVHIAHVSTRGSVDIVRRAKARGVAVTCETCPHYFCATDDEILSYNTNAKINPPLRTQDDVDAILEGLCDGTIDAIATDHAPHAADEKNKEFNLAPFGTSGFETAFSLAYTYLVETNVIDIVKLSKLMSANPARILGIGSGLIKEGERADITIADPEKSFIVDRTKFVSKGKNSLFHGWKLKGAVTDVLVDGLSKEIKSYD